MLELRPSDEISGLNEGWLNAKHHFSIGPYGNPAHGPVGNLYVLNDDEIAPHSGFPLHHHANVEIITYVRDGAVTHEDNLGNREKILQVTYRQCARAPELPTPGKMVKTVCCANTHVKLTL